MARSTGPIVVAGGVTWANNVLLGEQPEDLFTASARVGIATGIAAGVLVGVEKASEDFATALAWAALLTVLLVRLGNTPTPLERALSLVRR